MGEHIRNGDETYNDAGEIIGYRNPDGTNKYLVTSTSAESSLGAALAAMGTVPAFATDSRGNVVLSDATHTHLPPLHSRSTPAFLLCSSRLAQLVITER